MSTIEQGKALHQIGRVAEAEAAYRSVLARDPRQFDALHLLGLILYQRGRPREAHDLLSQAVKLRPRSPQALTLLMAALLAMGRLDEALAACDRMIAIDPRSVDALFNRALLLSRLRRFEDALIAFDKVLARDRGLVDALFERGNVLAALSRFGEAVPSYEAVLDKVPAHVGALTNRGNALARLGRHAEALACYDQLLALRPADVNVLSNRGIALRILGRHEEAMASCERALKIDPNSVAAWITRGNALAKLARYEEALASFERAAAIDPRDVEALNNRGFALTQLRRFGEALASFHQALAIDPANIGVLDNRGAALLAMNRFEDALADFDCALALKPEDAETLYHRGHALANLARYDEAVITWERVLAIEPDHPHALGALAFYRLMLCDWRQADEFEVRLKRALVDERAVVEPFTLLAYSLDPADQLRHTRRFVRHRIPAVPQFLSTSRPRSTGRLKVAYLSSSFNRHPTGWQIAELFERHDRTHFEVLGISYGPDDGSEIRARLVKAFDHFHDVMLRSDREVAQILFDLDVDIAIDLKGHTEQARPAILAYRPAPIQLSYFGYTASMGVDFIDYILADPVVLPFDQQDHYSEKIVHLPDSYWVNDSKRSVADEVPSRRTVGLPEDALVFCCFNNSYKITPQLFDIWMRLLRQVECSVLWLLQTSEATTRNLCNEARSRGVDPSRLLFAPRVEISRHLARHRLADLFLDNLPVNAHTAACDALWAGLPVLTCMGESFIGRVAASLLNAVGLPELVTRSLDEYEGLALKLATDRVLIDSIRRKLDGNCKMYPLFDTDQLRRHIESAYMMMCDIARRGEPPRSFAVDPG
jgi:predicted O-linked N-acetylglucosamine transferase (SPINDLY family)